MVSLRAPLTLGLAAALGLALGMPARTSQPSGFASAAAQQSAALPAPPTVMPVPASGGRAPSPSAPVLLALLRGTLAAVNQANITGNYSVLRDLGAPSFRENHTAAELADRFRPWRDNALDFAAVLLLDAKLSRPPSVDEGGVLRLAGYFPTAPLRIGFDLGFQAVAGNWRLATISVDAREAEAPAEVVSTRPPAAADSPTSRPVKVVAVRTLPDPVFTGRPLETADGAGAGRASGTTSLAMEPTAPTRHAATGQPPPFDMGLPPRSGGWPN